MEEHVQMPRPPGRRKGGRASRFVSRPITEDVSHHANLEPPPERGSRWISPPTVTFGKPMRLWSEAERTWIGQNRQRSAADWAGLFDRPSSLPPVPAVGIVHVRTVPETRPSAPRSRQPVMSSSFRRHASRYRAGRGRAIVESYELRWGLGCSNADVRDPLLIPHRRSTADPRDWSSFQFEIMDGVARKSSSLQWFFVIADGEGCGAGENGKVVLRRAAACRAGGRPSRNGIGNRW